MRKSSDGSEYVGKIYRTKDGAKELTIVQYNSYSDVVVRFVESGLEFHTNMGNVKMGLPNPFKNSVVAFDDPVKALNGCYFPTNNSCAIKILDASSYSNTKYQFQDEFGYIGTTTMQNIRKGQVRNPYSRDNMGGYLGEGPYTDGYQNIKSVWKNLLIRGTGYRSKYLEKDYLYGYNSNVGICDEWMCFNLFADWYINSLAALNPNFNYQINKDVLFNVYAEQTNGAKYYSPETVELVPADLTDIIMKNPNPNQDVMKRASDLADNYFSQGGLTSRAYTAIKTLFCKCPGTPPECILLPHHRDNIMKNHVEV